MNDSSAEIDARLRELLMSRSSSDRVWMVSEMFDFGRALVIAGVKADHADISPAELRVKIFERTYGADFNADERARIIARIRASSP